MVVAGHTHHPDQVPLPQPPRRWRDGALLHRLRHLAHQHPLRRGENFARIRACTMVFCYDGDERTASGDDRRFETWTGHLAAGDLGPFEKERGPLPRRARSCVSCAARSSASTRANTRDGAELLLRMGVDGRGSRCGATACRNGVTFDLDGSVDLQPALDGELWCCGAEVDAGLTSFWDSDDPLPWAVAYLVRVDDGAFLSGPGALYLQAPGRRPDHRRVPGHRERVEFFFDLSSPYSYLRRTQIDALAARAGAEVVWRPFVLGAVLKATGNTMPASVAPKARYMLADLARWAGALRRAVPHGRRAFRSTP